MPKHSDLGWHNDIRYKIRSHKGDWRNSWKFAWELNTPLIKIRVPESVPNKASLFEVSSNVQVGTVKKWESSFHEDTLDMKLNDNEVGIVVRLVEREGKSGSYELKADNKIIKAIETDLLERAIDSDISLSGKTITGAIGAYEIKTIKLILTKKS